jgi:protein PhnA
MSDTEETIIVRDCNGNQLFNGDSVHVIKDLDVRGMSKTLKRGEVINNIKLTEHPGQVECRIGKSEIVLKTEFLKKKN